MTDQRGHPFIDTAPTPSVVASPAPVEAPVSNSDVMSAHWLLGGQDIDSLGYQAELDAYSPVVNALTEHNDKDPNARRDIFGNTREYFGAYRSNHPLDYQGIWDDVNRIRKTEPGFLSDIPANNYVEFTDWVKKREQAKRLWGEDIVNRQRGFVQGALGFGTDVVGGFRDPVNLSVMALTGGAAAPVDGAVTSIWSAMARGALREGLINGGVTIADLPTISQSRARFGENMTFGDAAAEVGTSMVTGGLFGAAVPGLKAGGRTVADGVANSPLGRAALPFVLSHTDLPAMGDGAIARRFSDAIPSISRTPDEQAALHVLNRQADIAAANPFEPTVAGMDAHADNLDRAMADIVRRGSPDAVGPTPAARRVPEAGAPGVPRETSASVPQPVDATASIEAVKSRIHHAETSPGHDYNAASGAMGPYQFTAKTWTGLYRKRFGGAGMSDDAIAALRRDPQLNDTLMNDLLAENAATLRKHGIPETPGNLYMLHFLGPGEGPKVLRADPSTPVDRLVRPIVIEQNPFLRGKTVGDVVEWAHARMGDGGTADRPMLRPEQFGGDADALALSQRAIDAADAEAERLEFTTARGSTYRVEADGSTTRDKAARADLGHEGQEGPQPTSDATHYVTPDDALKLSEFQAQGQPKVAIASLPDGRIGMKYLEGKDAGKVEQRTVVTPRDGPAVGLTPVETWRDGTRVHFGNEITEVRRNGPVAGEEWDFVDREHEASARRMDAADAAQEAYPVDDYSSRAPRDDFYNGYLHGLGEPIDPRGRQPNEDMLTGSPAEQAGIAAGREALPRYQAEQAAFEKARGERRAARGAAAEARSVPATEHAYEGFDKPTDKGAATQIDNIEHDVRAALESEPDALFRTADGADRKLSEILAAQDEEAAALATVKSCL